MKWIKYKVLQSEVNNEKVFVDKKIGYSDANLLIAQNEAYNGYTIEEDSEKFENKPVGIEHGGTGASTKAEALKNLGLDKVPNVATNDQTPTYTEAGNLENLSSGEKLGVAFGKIKKAIANLIAIESSFSKLKSGKYVGTGTSGENRKNQIPVDFIAKVMVITRISYGSGTGETAVLPFYWKNDGRYAYSNGNYVLAGNMYAFSPWIEFEYDSQTGILSWFTESTTWGRLKADLTTGFVTMEDQQFAHDDNAEKKASRLAFNQLNNLNSEYYFYIFG